MTKKERFIGEYLTRKMKGHKLPWGMAYYSLLTKHIDAAEKKWKQTVKFNKQ